MVYSALHRLLGRPPGPITDELVTSAYSEALEETDDFDWKQELPDKKALNLSDFPKDVAAMANRGGGTLVYGVSEHEKKPTGWINTPEVDENYEQSLRRVAVSAIVPPVFGLTVAQVGKPKERVVVVVVPASIEWPHLIYRNDFFGAPVRNDADTVWMREGQLERMYRARFDARRIASEGLAGLSEDVEENWTDPTRACLVAVARPRLPIITATRPSVDDAQAILSKTPSIVREFAIFKDSHHPLANVDIGNPRPGLHQWIAQSTAMEPKTLWRAAWAGVHHDGSVSVSATVGGYLESNGSYLGGSEVLGTSIEGAVADFMGLLRSTSIEREINEFDVQIKIVWRGLQLSIVTRDNNNEVYYGSTRPLSRFAPIHASVVADAPLDDFHRQVYELAQDCVNQGGVTTLQVIAPLPAQ